MASVKKQLKKLTKRQDALERAMRDLKPKRLRRLLRRPDKSTSRKPRVPSLSGRAS
jgi:hypothetical protein